MCRFPVYLGNIPYSRSNYCFDSTPAADFHSSPPMSALHVDHLRYVSSETKYPSYSACSVPRFGLPQQLIRRCGSKPDKAIGTRTPETLQLQIDRPSTSTPWAWTALSYHGCLVKPTTSTVLSQMWQAECVRGLCWYWSRSLSSRAT